MATNDWIAAVAGNWSTAGNWSLGHKPAAGEDITMGGTSDQNCVVDEATAALNSLDMTGYSGVLSSTNDITVTVASGTSTVKFAGSPTWSGVLKLNPAAGTTINLTMGSLTTAGTIGGITIAGTTTGQVIFLDGVTTGATKILTLTSGTLHTDGAADNSGLTHSWGSYVSTGSSTRTINWGNSTVALTQTVVGGTPFNTIGATNYTSACGTSTINITGNVGAGNTFYFRAEYKTFYNLNFSGTGTAYISELGNTTSLVRTNGSLYLSDPMTFGTLSVTGSASKTDYFVWGVYTSGTMAVTSALTLAGNSATNRLLVRYNILGTARTVTLSGATISTNNVDFRDITFARSDSGALDLTAGGTNSVGDCGGNSKTLGDSSTLTFTTPYTQTVTGNSVNWDVAPWTGTVNHVPPLPQDNVVVSLTAGQTLTANQPRLGKDISFTTATNLTLGNAVTSYGSVDLTGMGNFGTSQAFTLESQARTGTQTLTSAGKQYPGNGGTAFVIAAVGATVQLADAFSVVGYFLVVNGTFIDSGYSMQANGFSVTGSNTRGVTKTGSWTGVITTASNVFDATNKSSLTWSDTAGSIIISNTGSNLKTFVGNGLAFYNLTTPSGTGGISITGANSFSSIQSPSGGKITFPASTTTTITGNMSSGFGNGANTLTILSSTGGTAATLQSNSGLVDCNYLDITDINVTPSNTWYYGNNSTWHSGTGWVADRNRQATMMGYW